VQVTIATSADTWQAMADRNQAEMAILNLAINARDAMPAGGHLSIIGGNACVGEPDGQVIGLQPGEYVVVAVKDTGTGMTPDVAARAFEPFFTTKQPGRGSGLGLSQVHGFAAQSGGAVEIESRLVQGTTVRLYLPRAHQEVAPVPEPRTAAPASIGQTILLVDDDAEVRAGIAAGLVMLGHTVIEAESGPEGVEQLRSHPEVSLLITDYAMPGMRGTVLAAEATRIRPDLAVLLISGFADLPDKTALQWTLLRKPFTPDELAACIAGLSAPMESSAAPA
jgi:CheY-like chemotaxis protein